MAIDLSMSVVPQVAVIGVGSWGKHFARIYHDLGALAINGQYTSIHGMGLVAPILILGIPIFDTVLVMAARALNDHPVYFGSPDHFALRLRQLAWSVRRVVISSYAVAIVLGGIALAIMSVSMRIAMVLTALAMIFLAGVGVWLSRVPMQRGVQATMEELRRNVLSGARRSR